MPASRVATLLRFSVVGLATAALYYGILGAGVEWLSLDPTAASSIAYPIVVCFNYVMHFHWTFGAAASHASASPRYLVMVVCGFVMNGAIMWTGVSLFHVNYLLTQAFAMAAVIAMNFLLSSLWVFRE